MALPLSEDNSQESAPLRNNTALAVNGMRCVQRGGSVSKVTSHLVHLVSQDGRLSVLPPGAVPGKPACLPTAHVLVQLV